MALNVRKIFAISPVSTYSSRSLSYRLFCGAQSNNSPDKSRGGLPRFFVDKLPSFQGDSLTISGPECNHMTRTLRLGETDRVELFDGKGGLVEAIITQVSKSGVQLLAAHQPEITEPEGGQWKVLVACASLKGGRADWLVEKCTELGAAELIPLLTQRSPSAGDGRLDRWRRVALSAAKQCQRTHQLVVREAVRVQEVSSQIQSSRSVALVASAEAKPLLLALPSLVPESSSGGMLIVGPEGDFTSEELCSLLAAGAVLVGLGPRRLRVETAAISLLSGVMLLEDSKPCA